MLDACRDQPVRQPLPSRLGAHEKARDRPDRGSAASAGSVGAEARPALFHSGTSKRGPICIQPSATPSAAPAARAAARLDARLDVILVAVAVAFAPHRRRQPKMRAPAAVTGTLLAEQLLEDRPKVGRQGHNIMCHLTTSPVGAIASARRLQYHLVCSLYVRIDGRSLSTISTHGFCRDCLTVQPRQAARCLSCGSPRLLNHAELGRLHFAHIDCDAFYAAVEKRDNPELKDKPVIIGGGKRGVVSTACYIARIRGVRSAMPMFKALEACPDAVVIPPDMEKYVRVGREVRAMMQALTPLVEPISIDEAFLDLPAPNSCTASRRRWCSPVSHATSSARSASPFRSGCPTASSSPRSPRT